MDDYVSKLEKCCCIVLPLSDFLSKDSYALKMADYGLISYFSLSLLISYSNACLASNLSLKLLL